MIENTLLHFKTKAAFNTELEAGNIKDDSITFVLDSKEIITHGESYKGVSWHSAGAVSDGVYAVSAKGELIDYTTADATALGVALVAGEHKFMIAKSDATSNDRYYILWTSDTSDLSLTNYSNADGTNSHGHLPKPDGTFVGSTHLSDDFTTWTNGALSDFNGKDNTEVIAAASSHAKDMCTVLNTFNQTEQTAGRSADWYVPACGQLALMYLAKTDINAALAKIGGTALAAGYYWSSSEYSSDYAWYVHFNDGRVNSSDGKYNGNRVRFIRDIEIITPVNQTFIHYPEKSQFTTQLESGNIPNETIVFIDDTKEIWTHGTYYGCSELDLSNIATKEELASKLDITTADSNYWKRTETVNQAVSSEFASSAYTDDKDNRISTTYATKTEVTTGLNGKINLNGTVTSVIAMTQSEYDALSTKDPRTLYIITES